ncbi:MAG: hypothetical protein JWO59_1477 [Chloroflexi bacterium]|nr:hypothetical protein [Chloroflexota bacterium]
MHWSGEMSDALAALGTLDLNRGWEQYWQLGVPAALRVVAA